MRFQKEYDIPPELVRGTHSPAFHEFLRLWFADSVGMLRREVDLGFLSELTPDEVQRARNLLRRNLHLRYNHIIEGVAALHDSDSVPVLREMLAREDNPSRQLTIAGSLWKLARDKSFSECLIRMKQSKSVSLRRAHIRQVLWLQDERAIDLLIDMLDDADDFVRLRALKFLNQLEFGERFPLSAGNELPRQAGDYQARRTDKALREHMVTNMRKQS